MHVGAFMVPAQKVVTCRPSDSVQDVLDKMVTRHVGAIVVFTEGTSRIPIGLITKTDLLMAYSTRIPLYCKAEEIMTRDLDSVHETMSRDQAARVLIRNRAHHAIVVDKDDNFKGIISTMDIAIECAKDDQAWRKWELTQQVGDQLRNDVARIPCRTLSFRNCATIYPAMHMNRFARRCISPRRYSCRVRECVCFSFRTVAITTARCRAR
uniref:CBS domain-containing protein n=1 Tax=Craspedostauros australis TaxID=1486917 RepID=A0A7R9WUI7_9STRA|mmetsp:Transcript_19206/g.53360  ORF Transcript_19206/g.53360 Transcript_19206/m.53360 type:complete len:210 (+) Transcript_19206:411-1040(+)